MRGVLRAEVGDSAYKSWLKPLNLIDYADGKVRLSVPTRFMRDWVANHYGGRLKDLWAGGGSPVTAVEIFVLADGGVSAEEPVAAAVFEAPAVRRAPERIEGDVGAALDPRFKFDNFVVGKPNELAYAAARRVADSETATYNPLFLYGGVGLGKTHLMHAIAWHIRTHQPDRKVVYLSAEKFMYHFIRALRFQDTMA
ncbi:MAG: DnaA/Hda family protein, partial [Alphaproteobacteria bacterium]